MASVINTNIASLNAQRNLSTSQSALNTSIQRLSTGLRINSAKDDAAGLAISERFTTQINGLNQAVRNANDGISLAQTAEGALSTIGNSLQRMRTLAVQSRNATNSPSDREALQKEVTQLAAEIQRVAKDTSFNGTKLLDGSFSAQTFQVGANRGETITIDSITNATTGSLGKYHGFNHNTGPILAPSTTATDHTLVFGDDTITFSAAHNAKDIAAAINNAGITGLSARALATEVTGGTAGANATLNAGIVLNGTSIEIGVTGSGSETVTAAVTAINDASEATGVRASIATGGELVLTAADGRNIDIAAGTVDGLAAFGLTAATGTAAHTSSVDINYVAASGEPTSTAVSFTSTALTALAGTNNSIALIGGGLAGVDISTATGAEDALTTLEAALNSISSARADLGAIQNRFTSVVSNLQVTAENLSASRSRILDTDFAEETANLTRGQILQQAGTAMLAQANSLPNTVLTLLQG